MLKKWIIWIKNHKRGALITLVLLVLLGIKLGMAYQSTPEEDEPIPFEAFQSAIEAGTVESVIVNFQDPLLTFTSVEGNTYQTDNPKSEGFKRELLEAGIAVEEKSESEDDVQMIIAEFIMQGLLLFVLFFFLMRMMNKRGSSAMTYLEAGIPGVDFETVAGNVEAKEEMTVLVDFLKEPKRFNDKGATLPKGTIFYGPPGTGKTLMAKAVAGEAGVPFISMSGSDFVEMYVGTGAKRVRELFNRARKEAPCIIFIDEIDAVGSSRGNDSNSEYKQTVNALLSEMDGFGANDNIVVIAATNRLEDLDPALIRPGRFDKQVAINNPDREDRYAILNVHAKGKTFHNSVDLKEWAESTIGFSGADLEALLNEATILSVVADHSDITNEDLDDAHYKMVMKGHKKKNQKGRREDELSIVAWHEAGHALVAKKLAQSTVPKVSILSSTSGAGGVTFITPSDKALPSKKDLKQRIQMLYAGRIAESLLMGNNEDITAGASQDIKEATRVIRVMLTEYGMSDVYGMINPMVLSPKDEDSSVLLKEATLLSETLYVETEAFLRENQADLQAIAEALLEKETLTERELDALLLPQITHEDVA